mmetsp:Transcript_39151/g.92117  ORF Transcript_39151/g.92117 Transcript_39151/m.92117 type:complete len:172 (+) Transcript_39151:577-1092(+)
MAAATLRRWAQDLVECSRRGARLQQGMQTWPGLQKRSLAMSLGAGGWAMLVGAVAALSLLHQLLPRDSQRNCSLVLLPAMVLQIGPEAKLEELLQEVAACRQYVCLQASPTHVAELHGASGHAEVGMLRSFLPRYFDPDASGMLQRNFWQNLVMQHLQAAAEFDCRHRYRC